MKDILFIRPADDSAAIQVGAWGQAVRLMARRFSIDDLSGAPATRANVDRKLSRGFHHLFYFGHGNDAELIAAGSALIDVHNIGKLDGLVIAIACYSAITLGRSARSGSPKAFLGFDDELGFPSNAPLPTMFAVTRGLSCLFQKRHEIKCAANQLRKGFALARQDYEKNGTSYGLSPAEIRWARLFAKSNQYSVRMHGDATTVL